MRSASRRPASRAVGVGLSLALVCLAAAVGCKDVTTVRGPGGEKLTATTPRAVNIRRGESIPLEVGIDRVNFTGPVTVSISQLPRGIEVDKSSQNVETTSATFVLKASKTADLVANQAVLVTVESPDGRKASQYIDLTVAE